MSRDERHLAAAPPAMRDAHLEFLIRRYRYYVDELPDLEPGAVAYAAWELRQELAPQGRPPTVDEVQARATGKAPPPGPEPPTPFRRRLAS